MMMQSSAHAVLTADGRLEVFAFDGVVHLGQRRVGLRRPIPRAQARERRRCLGGVHVHVFGPRDAVEKRVDVVGGRRVARVLEEPPGVGDELAGGLLGEHLQGQRARVREQRVLGVCRRGVAEVHRRVVVSALNEPGAVCQDHLVALAQPVFGSRSSAAATPKLACSKLAEPGRTRSGTAPPSPRRASATGFGAGQGAVRSTGSPARSSRTTSKPSSH